MTMSIEQFTVEPVCDCPPDLVGYDKNGHIEEVHSPLTYWGVYLDDEKVSTASTREQAEKTRDWMQSWLANEV